ncbi:MAG: hypothetical protein GY714_22440 [Desulfobacterales bacterium]|nr:hypothetical protein [Desulfobacterales bacterium]
MEISEISHHIIPFLIYNPLISIFIIGCLKRKNSIKLISITSSIINIFVCFYILIKFDITIIKPQFTELSHWLVFLNLDYSMGLTGISVVFIGSISIIIFILLLYEFRSDNIKQKSILILTTGAGAIGYFASLNTVLMFFFINIIIISLYLSVSFFEDNLRSKIILTVLLISSLLFLSSSILIYANTGSFYHPDVNIVKDIAKEAKIWIFLLMNLSVVLLFSIFPIHIISVHKTDSDYVSTNIIISAIIFKIGIYNFIKFCIPFCVNDYILYIFISFALISFFYCSILAFTRKYINELFSYIMISHAAISFVGALFINNDGVTGSIMHIINMGFIIPGIFICYGFMFRRSNSAKLDDNRVISFEMPKLSIFIIFFSLALIGFPATGTFISEFLIISGGFKKNLFLGALMIIGLIIAAIYVINYTRIMIWGDSDINVLNLIREKKSDIKPDEIIILLILVFVIIINGLFPKIFIDMMNPEISTILKMF